MKLRCVFILLFAGIYVFADPLRQGVGTDELVGEWDVYIVNHDEKNLLADYYCEIRTDGTVDLIMPAPGGKKVWGRMIYQQNRLTLQLPDQEVESRNGAKTEKRGLIAAYADRDVIEFRNDFQPDLTFRLERRRDDNKLTLEWLTGSWSLFQKNLQTGEERRAPFELVFSADGSYSFTGEGAERLNKECAGTGQIENNRLFLKNRCRERDSLWFGAVFFRDDERLVLNRLDAFVRAERSSALPRESQETGKK